jgi:hypothetical protein
MVLGGRSAVQDCQCHEVDHSFDVSVSSLVWLLVTDEKGIEGTGLSPRVLTLRRGLCV